MSQASQTNREFKGINTNVDMTGAVADFKTAIGSIDPANFTVTLQAGSPPISSTDIGKTFVILGAGGTIVGSSQRRPLEAKIISVPDSSHAVLQTAASVGVSNVACGWGTDNSDAIQAAINVFGTIRLPIGNYFVGKQLSFKDTSNKKFIGFGDGSVLFAGSLVANNFIDISGASRVSLASFQIDGTFFPDLSFEAIYGDGSVKNPTYGDIRVRLVLLSNWQPLGFGIGANFGNTAQDITYELCRFVNCGSGSFGANCIDTGSSGTKLRYRIIQNQFVFVTKPTANPGNAIFAGHGVNRDFEITGNLIDNAPTTGIAIYNRPFAGESTAHTGTICSMNIIRNSGWNGISNFGASDVVISGNTIINPGQSGSINENRCGIYLSDQQTGASYSGAVNVSVAGNVITDDQGSPTMRYGIYESLLGTSPTSDTAGQATANLITGYSVADVTVLSKLALLRITGALLSAGKAIPVSPFNVAGNIRAQGVVGGGTGLFTEQALSSAVAAGNFVLGEALNLHFDGTNWQSGADGGSNGAGAMLLDYGTGKVLFISVPKTGGTPQTISPGTLLSTNLFFVLDPSVSTIDVKKSLKLAVGAGSPLKTDGGSIVIADKISATSSSDINVSGLTAGLAVSTNGSVFTSLSNTALATQLEPTLDGRYYDKATIDNAFNGAYTYFAGVVAGIEAQISDLQNQINAIPAGPTGPDGPTGPIGPTGPTGP